MKTIGNNIRKIREPKDFSQQNMADALQISQSEYCRIEKGQIKLDTGRLKKIAAILNVKMEIIYNFDEEKMLI